MERAYSPFVALNIRGKGTFAVLTSRVTLGSFAMILILAWPHILHTSSILTFDGVKTYQIYLKSDSSDSANRYELMRLNGAIADQTFQGTDVYKQASTNSGGNWGSSLSHDYVFLLNQV